MSSEECVVGIYKSFSSAKDAIQALKNVGLPPAQISLIASGGSVDDPALHQPTVEEAIQHGDRTEKRAAAGAGLGGLLGLLVGGTALAIPGLGPVVVGGALAAGLTGALVGGFLGAMAGWGVPEDQISKYEAEVKEGNLLVIVHGDPLQVAEAQRVLQATEPQELHLHASTADESPEVDDRP